MSGIHEQGAALSAVQKTGRIPEIYAKATEILKELYGRNASFRDGQYEAIEAAMTRRRTLVVQRTGWGKSLVYFICTKLMREQGRGVTMVVSPLLALMENQIEAARKLGLNCDVLNSTVRDRRPEILESLKRDALDLILVTPETLFSEDVQAQLRNIRIGLFVIDEAHCISDWGHDFRLEYGRLKMIIRDFLSAVPVLATTATANDRVVKDLQKQLGDNVFISKGPLARDSLHIQVLNKPNRIDRYAWILENVPRLPGSGIIYCLTQRDCEQLAAFLKGNNIAAAAYYSRQGKEGEAINREIEEKFRKNELKVIVATIKLGMGYDKGDIAFVIHYQMPKDIVSYYQQIGRAGRNIDKAYAFLMCGKEDEEILEYFIREAFPTEQEFEEILKYIEEHSGAKLVRMKAELNMRGGRIDKILSFLIHDGFVWRERDSSYTYYRTPKKYVYDREHYEGVTAVRRQEIEQMKHLAKTRTCYSRYIASCLDDPTASDCGHCANCLGRELLPSAVSDEYIHMTGEYLDQLLIPIEPRKMWTGSAVTKAGKIPHINRRGLCISKYGDPGCGELVRRGKYLEGRFCDELVEKSAEVLRPIIREEQITHICCVPSLRSDLVKDFTVRLSAALGLPFADVLQKAAAKPQKEMENAAHQCENACRSFSVKADAAVPRNILLVDDVVDSRWTFTVCGNFLMEAGAEKVYPFALADSSREED